MNTEYIDQWFPVQQQRDYVSKLLGHVGLTRRRAEYFVRLWAYLLLKQRRELGESFKQPLRDLNLPSGFISCTHREAAELFYGTQDRGSDRAAGMMLDKLAALKLIRKEFDGNTICIQICPPFELAESPHSEAILLKPDRFDPRTDTIPVATFLARNYNWRYKNTAAIPHQIVKTLRDWAQLYPRGMRVLRRCDNFNPVGFYVFYPTAAASEENFFLPPRKSFHLSSADEIDPIQMAKPGDLDCTAVFVRSWMIDPLYMQPSNVNLFLQDSQKTLLQMKEDFPNLCDIQTLIIHPSYEKLAQILGFQKTGQGAQSGIYWMYLALDRFLALNVETVLGKLDFEGVPAEL